MSCSGKTPRYLLITTDLNTDPTAGKIRFYPRNFRIFPGFYSIWRHTLFIESTLMFLKLCTFGLLATQLMLAQQFRTDGIAIAPGDNIKIDLSSVTDIGGASITIRNSATSPISLPQITNTETLWPYSADAIIQHIQPQGTDQEIA